jgi:TRAP-type C4-dicarboxylate transport system permease small subunit
MKIIIDAYNYLLQGMRVASGVVIFSVFLMICADVFMRLDIFMRLTGIPPCSYISGVVEYGLLWFTMLAAPYLVRIKGHVFIDAITQLLQPRYQAVMAKFAYLICICSSLVFAYYSFDLLVLAIVDNQIDTRGEDMWQWTLMLPIPICFFMVAFEFIRYLIGIDSMYGDRTEVKDSV